MLKIDTFTFNPFSENTYLLSDGSGECVIVDPGCYTKEEKEELSRTIEEKSLKPVKILLTHAHIDHILGNNYLAGKYNIPIVMNSIEIDLLHAAKTYGEMWGIVVEPSPAPEFFLNEGDVFTFGQTKLDVIFTPGHSPGSFSYFDKKTNQLLAGDVLFHESIGRTDLPGGNFSELERSIQDKLYMLPENSIVYPGHGSTTTIGHEKKSNPFVRSLSA